MTIHVEGGQKTFGIYRASQRRGRTYAAFLLAAVSHLALTSAAQAQDAVATPSADVETVVVTGTLIPTGTSETVSPVTQIDSELIRQQGTTRIEDMLNRLPQVYSSLSTSSKAATAVDAGTATVDLRDLGSQRTLVLVNGRRLMPGDPLTGQAANLDNIPSVLVDRIDVVTGGASATYGSDAVAGVVNFVMKSDLDGIILDAQYSGYQHNNGRKLVQGPLQAAGIALPDSEVWDGGTLDVNAAFGVNTSDGKGNITIYTGYRKSNQVLDRSRDYTACQLSSGNSFGCTLGGVTYPAQFLALTPSGGSAGAYTIDPATGNTLIPYNSKYYGYNGAESNLQRPATRVIGGAFATYDVAPHIQLYAELMAMDNRSYFYQTPAGTYGGRYTVVCNNPMMTAQEASILCGSSLPSATVPFQLSLRNSVGGPRIDDVRNDAYRLVAGARGELGEGWHYDLYAQSGTTLYSESLLNAMSAGLIQKAINVVVDPQTNKLVCAVTLSGADRNCLPYNIFQAGGITQAATNYIEVPAKMTGSTTEQVFNATITGDLAQYGIQSPYAEHGIGVALGSQYRRESLTASPDEEWQSGDLAGSTVVLPVSGSFSVYEFYGELSAPLVQNEAWAKNLSFNSGYRYSHYSSSGGVSTYKFGGEWSPVDDIRFRGSYQHAVRAPSVVELYSGQRLTIFGGTDPCGGPAPTASLAQCANTGVTSAQYGNIPTQNNEQPNALSGGNPNLMPEASNTKSFGMTVTPSWVQGLSLTVDYFNIDISKVIGTLAPNLALTQCVATGNPTYCSLIHRAPGTGALFSNVDGYVVATTVNLGAMSTSGIDFQANYAVDLNEWTGDDLGTVNLSFFGTYLTKYRVTPIAGLGSYDCQGLYGPICGQSLVAWRHQAYLNWQTPWYDLNVGLTWRHIGGTDLEKTSSSSYLKGVVPPTDARISNVDYFDVTLTEPLSQGLTLRVGMNNVFDRDPPLIGLTNVTGTPGAGTLNTFPLYDVMGRYLFVSVSAKM